MNTIPKLVASRTLTRVDDWENSQLLHGDLVAEVVARKATQDLIVVGSASIAKTLIAHDLVDEFRLMIFPLVIGAGTRLFDDGTPIALELISTERSGAGALLTYQRATPAKNTSRDHAVGAGVAPSQPHVGAR